MFAWNGGETDMVSGFRGSLSKMLKASPRGMAKSGTSVEKV